MSHHIYHTKAFIVDSLDTGEANKLITLFTPDLGLILAVAQGVRLMKSKLRPSIQNLSFSKVSLVRGREVWRLTNAEKLISLYDRRIPLAVRKMMARNLAFVRRLSPGESRHEELFTIVSKLYAFCMENKTIFTPEIVELTELLAKLRILHALGYGSDDPQLALHITSYDWSDQGVASIAPQRAQIEAHIQHALMSSHL